MPKGLLFKTKTRTAQELVRATRDLLVTIDQLPLRDIKREEKVRISVVVHAERKHRWSNRNSTALCGWMVAAFTPCQIVELVKAIREMKIALYGNSECEPVPEVQAQLTQEVFRENTFRLLILVLPKLELEARKDITQVVVNLQRQQVQHRLVACDYLEANKDLLDRLVAGYENPEVALHYGSMLRECIRHQSITRYVLESENMAKIFGYFELPNFDVSSDVAATFKELLTRHKATVAEYLNKNYVWFFSNFNTKLLESEKYITRRLAVKLLGDILLDRANVTVMMRYVSSKENLIILMTLLKDPSKTIQVEAFHVFKVFVANANKPADIVNILVCNRTKLLRFFSTFKTEKEDEQFEQDKEQVVNEISSLSALPGCA